MFRIPKLNLDAPHKSFKFPKLLLYNFISISLFACEKAETTNINNSPEINFVDGMFAGNLIQINSLPNKMNNILDIIFEDESLILELIECAFPTCKLDMHHVPLFLSLLSVQSFLISTWFHAAGTLEID
ncbi:unnamed protein product [Ceratitis capitata]|uniref:(Mediterranean fruit fly) hypothetical protein n=1 Tax=Ceratitis capitata TaxID=7213 RepID=A0A811U3S3_CERCA|nr:unnamed protein product [Ceratitis capitata]